MSCLWHGQAQRDLIVGFLLLRYSVVLVFIISPFCYLDLHVHLLGDDASIFNANPKYTCVLIQVGTGKHVPPVTVLRRCFFCGSFLCHVCLCYAVFSVPCSLVITCWEMADFLAPLCVMFSCVFVTFQYDAPGQVWYFDSIDS